MFTVSSPENPHLGPRKSTTLKDALKIKATRQRINEGCHFVIVDGNGYVVSTLEQRNYLCSIFF
jgi:hypothetical protein